MRATGALLVVVGLLVSPAAQADTPPTAAWQAYQAGQAAMARENFPVAERQFRLAIQEDRRLSLAHYGLGTVLAATKRYQEALDSFTQAIAVHREWLAQQSVQAGRLDQARDREIQELRDSIRAIESGAVKYQSSQKVIQLEQRIQQLEREKSVEKTGAKGTVPAEFFVALGSAHHRLGHVDEARQAYEEALKIEPARGDAHSNLAALALARGDKDGAREHVRLAEAAGFRVNPDLKRDAGLAVAANEPAAPAAKPAAPVASPAVAAPAPAEPSLAIDHQPLSCALVGAHPVVRARLTGPVPAASMRVHFSSGQSPYQYTIRMKPDGDAFVTRLPKPKLGLTTFSYSIDATDNAAASARTETHTVTVAATAAGCAAALAPATQEALLVEIPSSAPARPPVPEGFDAAGVKGSGGTSVGWLPMPAKLGAGIGVVAAAGVAVAGRKSIYKDDGGPVDVVSTQVNLVSITPNPGTTLMAPSQQVQATFRITMGQAARRLFMRVRFLQASGISCFEIAQARNDVEKGATVELTAIGVVDPIRFCGDSFDVSGVGVQVMADTDIPVPNQFFELPYKVVRTTPSN